MTNLDHALQCIQRLGVDTAPVIYFIEARLGDHPIHAGLPRNWMAAMIEVYTHARGPAENLTVLSWAEDPATKTRWPIEWTVTGE